MLMEANIKLEDLLNQIVWMSSASDIVDTIIGMGAPVVIGLLLFGVLQCFFGYKLFRFELGLIGGSCFGVAAYLGCRFLLHYAGWKLIGWTAFAAFMGAGMLFTVSGIIVFLFTLAGSTIGLMILNSNQGWDMLPQIMIILALTIAAISVVFYRHVILIGNALFGAALIGFLMSGLFDSSFFGVLIGAVFAVFGLFAQYWMYIVGRRKQREREAAEEAEWLARKSKVVEDDIKGVAKAENTDLDYGILFPSQSDIEKEGILHDEGLKPSERTDSPVVGAKREMGGKGGTEERTAPQVVRPRANPRVRSMVREEQERAIEEMLRKESQQTKQENSGNLLRPKLVSSDDKETMKTQGDSGFGQPAGESAATREQSAITDTGTISVGQLHGQIKRLDN